MGRTSDSNRPKGQDIPRVILLVAQSVFETRCRELALLQPSGSQEVDLQKGVTIALPSGQHIVAELYHVPEEALNAIERQPVNVILVDNREATPTSSFANSITGRILPGILANTTPGRAPSRRSIFVILPEHESVVHQAYAVGVLQLGGVFVNPSSLAEALESTCRTVSPPEPGKVALCLAGGGIEGMIYELGVLRALDAHLGNGSVTDFDIFSGISAGAVLGAFLANGVHPDELKDTLHKRPSRVSPMGRDILFDPNLTEMATRVFSTAGDLVRGRWLKKPVETALKLAPTAFFSGDRLKWHIEKELNKPGMTNDFNQLKKELFVGVTDQDSGEHVIFGTKGFRDIPISHALRASTAMTPYYPPEKIKGRYFIDGIFTRTVNLDVAVASGAKLIICVDPLTPVQGDQPGSVASRGGFFNSVQSIKALIRTRFSEHIGRAEEAFPNVAVFVFSPTREDLEQMSLTMMPFRSAAETEERAFNSVSERIQKDYEWLAKDFTRHGFELNRSPSK